ncbi:hypothetical protein AVEN_126962-1 [Araneus ventricosus]|uniref:Uncharacterized protein n=1 Tax=Araneus ventricosus TaxID=182803 RepID=A0A4Y2EF34_ARAVE|nr:hypothetical protein AVEN_126962-1 [Araneus ventricosus]
MGRDTLEFSSISSQPCKSSEAALSDAKLVYGRKAYFIRCSRLDPLSLLERGREADGRTHFNFDSGVSWIRARKSAPMHHVTAPQRARDPRLLCEASPELVCAAGMRGY